jgi:hypothetical protein
MAFLPNERGEIMYAAIGSEAFAKVPWYETIDFSLVLLGSYILLAFSAIIYWTINFIIQGGRNGFRDAAPRVARIVASLGCGLGLVFITILGINLVGERSGFVFGVPLGVYFLMVIPIVVAGDTVVVVFCTMLVWKNRYWSVWGRIHYTMVALALMGFIWFANTWNLLGFHFG